MGEITNNGHAVGSPLRRHHKVDGPDYEGEHFVAKGGVRRRMGDHDRSCRGRRSDEEEVRPWYRKDRQGSAHAVGHTHQAPHGHEAAIVLRVHILPHAYRRIHAVECVGGSHRDEGCSPEEDRGDRSSHRTERAGSRHRHRHGGP